jgi:HNH endonuclease
MKQINYPGLESYDISEDGKIYNRKTNRYRTPRINKDGYATVTFFGNKNKKTLRVHRLVALTYLKPNGWNIINHIDGNKLNNHWSNLEWCSQAHNRLHASKILGYNTNKHLFQKGNKSKSVGCRVIEGPKPGEYKSFHDAGLANGIDGKYLAAICRKGINSSLIKIEKL